MRRFGNSARIALLVAAVSGALCLAQTASEKPSDDARRVSARLKCLCGGCKDSVATCSMLECSFCKPAKERIARMQALGMSDEQIIQGFVRENGTEVYLSTPSPFGWMAPYAALAAGLVVLWLFLKKYRKPVTEAGTMEIDDPELAKYKSQIEEDLAKLE